MNVTTTLNLDTAYPTATLRCAGELDYTTTSSVVDAVRRVLVECQELAALHVDCAGLTFCDSAGLAGLLDIHERTMTYGVQLFLDNRPAQLDRLLDITGTYDHLVASTVAEPDQEPEETELG